MQTRRIALFCLAASLAVACSDAAAGARFAGSVDTLANGVVHVRNPATGMWKPGEEWTLVEELRIGTEDGEAAKMFGAIGAVEVDPAGRIYVLELQATEIRVFDAAGNHVRTMGRQGAGPGELNQPVGLQWDRQGRLWTVDQANARFSVFDTTGAFVTSHRKGGGLFSWQWDGGITRDGRLLAAGMRMVGEGSGLRSAGRVLIEYDSLVQPVDTFEIPQYDAPVFEHRTANSRTMMNVPFAPSLAWLVDKDGYYWAGVSDRYHLARVSMRGDTVRVVEREWTPAPVTAAERDVKIEELKGFRDAGGKPDLSRIPSQKPAFHRIVADDRNHLWVAPQLAEAEDGRVFDVFDAEGRYLGPVRMAEKLHSFVPVLVRGDRLYTVVLDEMEVPYVVRYRIQGRKA